MRRLTPGEVRQAYIETGLHPIRKLWYDELDTGEKCGCGAGAILVHEGKGEIMAHIVFREEIAEALGCTDPYLQMFLYGFDGIDLPDRGPVPVGYEDGRAAWLAVQDLVDGFLPMVVR